MSTKAPRTFISFDYDNNHGHKVLFAGQAKNSKTPFDIADWSSKSELPQATWEAQISNKISRCDIMIVLVGRSAGSAIGVHKEIAMAQKHGIPYFGVYVDGAGTSSTLPKGLVHGRVTTWEWGNIASAIEQVVKEGK